MKIKKVVLIELLIILVVVVFCFNVSEAALQSNPNVHYRTAYTLSSWVSTVRQMEKAGQAMGLEETQNSDLTAAESNNIDVHGMKSTEFGAIAILSASGYGNPQTLQNSTEKTTTGNKSGVYFSGANNEHVAAFTDTQSYDAKYYDLYEGTPSWGRLAKPKAGDAIGSSTATNPGCFGWHSAYNNNGYDDIRFPVLRGGGGLFGINANNHYGWADDLANYMHGVAISGEGI